VVLGGPPPHERHATVTKSLLASTKDSPHTYGARGLQGVLNAVAVWFLKPAFWIRERAMTPSSSPRRIAKGRRQAWTWSVMGLAVVVSVCGIASISQASDASLVAVGASATAPLMQKLLPTVDVVSSGATTGGAPSSSDCQGGDPYSASSPGPSSSAAGVRALLDEETAESNEQGCTAIARSAAPPSATGAGDGAATASHLQYFAFALDAVAPLVGSNSGSTAETSLDLTLGQIKDVYNCTISHWNDLGASSMAPIIRYWPEPGSSTASLYEGILGFDPRQFTKSDKCANSLIGTYLVSPHSEAAIVNNQDVTDAFSLYPAGSFSYQWDHPKAYGPTLSNPDDSTQPNTEGNWSASLTLASVDAVGGSAPNPFVAFTTGEGRGSEALDTTTVTETNEWYSHVGGSTVVPGVFYLYNVVDDVLPTYQAAVSFVGFDNVSEGAASALCDGADASEISAASYVPLGSSGGPSGTDQAGATCRELQGGSVP
jgi:hypothetical protein